MKHHPGYTELLPQEDWYQDTREEIAMKAAERKPPPLRLTDAEVQGYIDWMIAEQKKEKPIGLGFQGERE